MPPSISDRDERPGGPPAGWATGVLFDALMPLLIGIAILAFLILVFLGSSASGYAE